MSSALDMLVETYLSSVDFSTKCLGMCYRPVAYCNALLPLQTGNAEEIAKYSKRTTRVTQQHNDECKQLLQLMGVPIVTVCFYLLLKAYFQEMTAAKSV